MSWNPRDDENDTLSQTNTNQRSSNMTTMNGLTLLQFVDKWVADLRSGKYIQGCGYLHRPIMNVYCCLGVAADILGRERRHEGSFIGSLYSLVGAEYDFLGVNPDRGMAVDARNIKLEFLTRIRAKHGDIGDHQKIGLVTLNDDLQWSFTEIADFIDAHREFLFPALKQ